MHLVIKQHVLRLNVAVADPLLVEMCEGCRGPEKDNHLLGWRQPGLLHAVGHRPVRAVFGGDITSVEGSHPADEVQKPDDRRVLDFEQKANFPHNKCAARKEIAPEFFVCNLSTIGIFEKENGAGGAHAQPLGPRAGFKRVQITDNRGQ